MVRVMSAVWVEAPLCEPLGYSPQQLCLIGEALMSICLAGLLLGKILQRRSVPNFWLIFNSQSACCGNQIIERSLMCLI